MVQKLEKLSNPSAVQKNPCLKSMMEKLYADRNKTGDIKFMVDGELIHAHRCVLAALSPRYEAQFHSEKDTINVEDVSPAAFKEFLQFFYAEDVALTLDNIEDVLNLAKQSLVDELIDECTNFLLTVIGMDKLLWCYRLSRTYDVKPLEKYCVKLIGVNIKSLFEAADFLSCERNMLCRILDFESLNCEETEVFDACIAWARAKCEHDEIDATDTANLRLALDEAFLKIRFCSMRKEKFATISRNYVGLLSAQESVEVFQAIALKANGVHSVTFGENNSKPRLTIESSFVCSFGKERRLPFNSMTGICFIKFSTDKAIILNGFISCNKMDDDIRVIIILSESEPERPKNTKETLDNGTKIEFDRPIRIEAKEQFLLSVAPNAFKQPNSSLYGFELQKHTTQHGVSFAITDCTNPNLIDRLLFSIVDKI